MKHLLFVFLLLNITLSTGQNLTTEELQSEETIDFFKYIVDNDSNIYGEITKVNSEWTIKADSSSDSNNFILKAEPKQKFKAKSSKELIEKIIKNLTNDNRKKLKYEFYIKLENEAYYGYLY